MDAEEIELLINLEKAIKNLTKEIRELKQILMEVKEDVSSNS